MRHGLSFVCTAVLSLTTLNAWAQGQDGTPGQRNLQVMDQLLPGRYDNTNQAYFDKRLGVPEVEAHNQMHVEISRADVEDSAHAFVVDSVAGGPDGPRMRRVWVLQEDQDPRLVRMRMFELDSDAVLPFSLAAMEDRYLSGCDVLWRREAGHFRGTGVGQDCKSPFAEGYRIYELQLHPGALWINIQELDEAGTRLAEDNPFPYQLSRARVFECYVDIPGVAGGRDEPFERYPIEELHDQGGMHWFTTRDGERELGINLRNVVWPMNNEVGAFTRNSLVMSVLERVDGEVVEISYGWTEPQAKRIGLNLKQLLVNCFLVSNRDVTPYFEVGDPDLTPAR